MSKKPIICKIKHILFSPSPKLGKVADTVFIIGLIITLIGCMIKLVEVII